MGERLGETTEAVWEGEVVNEAGSIGFQEEQSAWDWRISVFQDTLWLHKES